MRMLRQWTFYAGLVLPAFVVVTFWWMEGRWPDLVNSFWGWISAIVVVCLGSAAVTWNRKKEFAIGVLIALPVVLLATVGLFVWAAGQNIVK